MDAKKSKGTLNSLKVFRNMNANNLAIKVSINNYGFDKENGLLALPYYDLCFFLDKNIADGKISGEPNK